MTSFAPCWMRRLEPCARRRVDVTGNGVNRAALLDRLRRGDERAAVQAGFDDENAVAPTADDAVAHRKCLAIGLDLHREFGNDRAVAVADFFRERGILRRIKIRQAGTDDRDGATFRGERALMRGGVDPARETADDREAGVSELVGKLLRATPCRNGVVRREPITPIAC